LRLEVLEERNLLSGVWTNLANLAPNTTGTMMLLSDGTVMVQGGGTTGSWYQLTPDSSGSYVNGTWSNLPSMRVSRLYYASNVLTDGRVFVVGGEYTSDGGFSRTGEIYDPAVNSWANTANFPQSMFGDDPTSMLPDGRVLGGYIVGPESYIFDPFANSWTPTGTKLRGDRSDEETWVKLPDDSVLSYDIFSTISTGVGHAQRYNPTLGQWMDAGTPPNNLTSTGVGYEMGPGLLLPDGRAFQIGATNHTAFYDYTTNTWTQGPDIPNNLGADDAPAAMMPNGHILFSADHPLFGSPTTIFDFDPTTNTYQNVTPSDYSLSGPAFVTRMLMLPSGDVLLTNASNQLIIYTPDGGPDPSWQPIIDGVSDNGDGTFTLTGQQLNGLSEGASYGDDAEMSSNYPLVQLTDADGNVFYARTFNWSSTGVMTGTQEVSTEFYFPNGIADGDYSLTVIANGIAANPVDFQVGTDIPRIQRPARSPINTVTQAATDFTNRQVPIALTANTNAPSALAIGMNSDTTSWIAEGSTTCTPSDWGSLTSMATTGQNGITAGALVASATDSSMSPVFRDAPASGNDIAVDAFFAGGLGELTV
jgi:hypothetical protein